MTYPTITLDVARKMLVHYDEHEIDDALLRTETQLQPGGEVDEDSIRDLSNYLFEAMLSVEGKRGKGAIFERTVARLVHEKLKLSPVVAGDAGFWRWLTFFNDGSFAEIIDLRYGKGAAEREGYMGFWELRKGFLAYLWLRANAVYDSNSSDPYLLSERGQSDLWTSHIVRVHFGSIPSMARAFIRLLHPDEATQALSVKEYRELIKELRRRSSSTLLELFDDESAYEFVERVWAERNEWWTEPQGAS